MKTVIKTLSALFMRRVIVVITDHEKERSIWRIEFNLLDCSNSLHYFYLEFASLLHIS